MQNRYWDLMVDDERFSVGLSFNQMPVEAGHPLFGDHRLPRSGGQFRTALPGAGGPDDGAEPHEPAENDGPVAVPVEDGSNVVAVDFKRKK